MFIGQSLQILLHLFIKSKALDAMKRFQEFIKKSLGIGQKCYQNYVEFFQFYTDYPRFQRVSIGYTEWRTFKASILDWYENPCTTAGNILSERYWVDDGSVDNLTSLFSDLDVTSRDRRDSGIKVYPHCIY